MPNDSARFVRQDKKDRAEVVFPFLRRLPHSVDAEMAVLGGCISDTKVLDAVIAEGLEPEHFMLEEHTRIFRKFLSMKQHNGHIDAVTLGSFFESDDVIAHMGGRQYVVDLVACACTPVNGRSYSLTIIDAYAKRQLIALSEEMANGAYSSDMNEDASKVIEKTSAALFKLSAKKMKKCKFRLVSDELDAIFNHSQERLQRKIDGLSNGIDTGIRALDHFIGGLEGGDMMIVAGRPSMGKTTLATSIVHNAALSGTNVGMFSLETSGPSIIRHNFLARATGYPGSLLRNPDPNKITKEQLELARQKAKAYYKKMPIYISDTILTVQAMGAVLREEIRTRKLELVVIDLISMVQPENHKSSLFEQTTQVCVGLKKLAKDLGVPFIVLCQLSRSVEMRDDKRPMLSDLRMSGEIEQASDIVAFVYRHGYYLDRHKPKGMGEFEWEDAKASARNKAEVIFAKNRQGEIGTAHVYCDLSLAIISDIERSEEAYQGRTW